MPCLFANKLQKTGYKTVSFLNAFIHFRYLLFNVLKELVFCLYFKRLNWSLFMAGRKKMHAKNGGLVCSIPGKQEPVPSRE